MTDEEADALAVARFQHMLIPSAIPAWIRRKVPNLNDERPIDLIKAGKVDDVVKQLDDWFAGYQ